MANENLKEILKVSGEIIDVFQKAYGEIVRNSSEAEKRIWIKHVNTSIRQILKLNRLENNLPIGIQRKLQTQLSHLKKIRILIKKQLVREPFKTGAGAGDALLPKKRSLRIKWEDVQTAFKSRIRSGLIINLIHKDISEFFKDAFYMFKNRIVNVLKSYPMIKVNCTLCGEFIIRKKDEEQTDFKYFNTKNVIIDGGNNLADRFKQFSNQILADLEEFQERDSGWALSKIIYLEININKFEIGNGAGSSFIRLPQAIAIKNACVNIKNYDDDACFFWAIISALYPAKIHPDRVSSYPHYNTKLNITGLELPMTLDQIGKFEKLNGHLKISVNVFVLELVGQSYNTVPARLCKTKFQNHINLLLIQDKYFAKVDDYELVVEEDEKVDLKFHYCYIKNLSRLVSTQLSKYKCKKFICDRCLNYFSSEAKLQEHNVLCEKRNNCKISFPNFDSVHFKNHIYKQKAPFMIYADFESLLENVSENEHQPEIKTIRYQQHKAFSAAYYVKCSYDDSLSFFKSYRGQDCMSWFTNEMANVAQMVQSKIKNIVPLSIHPNRAQAKSCHICEKLFTKKDFDDGKIVNDHDHFTGEFRGFACKICNLQFRKLFIVPLVFHNLSGYDSHFIIREISKIGKVSLLPINKEKYISLTLHDSGDTQIKIRFIDSLRFLGASLDELASTLNIGDLKILKKEFRNLENEKFQLLTRKGVFCYDFIDNIDKLNETELPSKDKFYNQLNDENISDEKYAHAQTIWREFKINNLGEYSDLYLKTDVLLLADVFENFRTSSHSTYGLDPAWYYTLPGYTWDCMLKYTKCELELLKDVDQILFVESGLRGGISMCSNRYSEANNKYMSEYNPEQPSKYLMYLDANNLYGWAMSQYLPYGNFKWLDANEITNFDVTKVPDDADTGFIIEADIQYPRHLHDVHKDFPFCAEHKIPPNSKNPKLLNTLSDKNNYVLHYRNLKQALKNGLKIKKLHRILSFRQAPWLKSYIDLNTNLRAQAITNFAKNLFKLMNNAVFGKTMENIRKHRIVKLIKKWGGRYGAQNLIASPLFHSRAIFDENLVAIEMNKSNLVFNKPLYIGMAILDISKTLMYDFHYQYMLEKSSLKVDQIKLMYTDTDSFIYEICCGDVYEELIKSNLDKFDTSDYDPNNIYKIPQVNKKVVGLMKDEANGQIMTHFVGLRSKMYSFKLQGGKCIKKSKGVKYNVVKNKILFNDYVNCLEMKELKNISQCCIRSIKHNVFSVKQSKIALNPFDDKRCILNGSHDTLPWGHYNASPAPICYWEGNHPDDYSRLTYKKLLEEVCRFANVLKSRGVQKGDRVAVYMPMILEAVITLLACARIGAVHSLVFAGFSSDSFAERILDCDARVLVTADGVWRGEKLLQLKNICDQAMIKCSKEGHNVETCIVVSHLERVTAPKGLVMSRQTNKTPMTDGRDIWWQDIVPQASTSCYSEWMQAEDPLFMLYTSGSTGKPKGVLHTTAGYLLYAATTFKYVFDYKPNDVYWCTADVGWITGHSYVVYGPLANAATSVLFEGTPFFPGNDRFWSVVDKYKVSQFYTAPTAIRSLMKFDDDLVARHNLSSLRVLGSVGEPINPEAWMWYYKLVGHEKCSIVDTFWQTETGGHVLTTLPGAQPMKPGAAGFPFFGVEPVLLDENGKEIKGEGEGYLVFSKPWPGLMRTLYGNHDRYELTYFSKFPGYYCTGDGAKRDADGYLWVTGRVDDMLNVSGHLMSTAEVESVLTEHHGVAEAAVVAKPHPVKGECLYCFITLTETGIFDDKLLRELKTHIRERIGPFAQPDVIQNAPGLPKTRSGKIMRRILRKIAVNDRDVGDISTLADSSVVELLFQTRPANA